MTRRFFSSVLTLLFLVWTVGAVIAQDDPLVLDQLNAEKKSQPATEAEVATEDKAVGPTLVAGSKVSLAAVTGADWVQGKAPKSWEPGKVYMFECWATWCGPCIVLIPHVNDLHKKYYDKGLRVYGMSSYEDRKDKVEKFVERKGVGMSYPVAFTGKGSAFETEWLDAAGVKAIPFAFVVRNGKLLLATEASRITDSLVETMLSGDEGAKKAAALINSANNSHVKTGKAIREFTTARYQKDAEKMAAKLKELEAIDPNHPELLVLKLHLLMVREDWPAAVAALNEMPASSSKNSFLAFTGLRLAKNNGRSFPMGFIKAVTIPYTQYIEDGGKSIGPNHFAALSILQWKIGDKQAATTTANKGVDVAKTFAGASGARTGAFKRFAKSVNKGTMPELSDLLAWQREAKKKADAKKATSQTKE